METTILLILFCAAMDRARGDEFDIISRAAEKLFYGAAVGALAGATGLIWLAFAGLFALGASPGWGAPMGAYYNGTKMGPEYEWWQAGPLRTDPLMALAARGVIWAAPIAPVCWYVGSWWPVVGVIVGLPVSCIAARKWWGGEPAKTQWNRAELLRGAIVGSFAAIHLV